MKIVVLDGYALCAGDLSFDSLGSLGMLSVYDRTPPEMAAERIADAQIVLTNKVPITREVISACGNLSYIGVTATGYNVVDLCAASERGIVVTNAPAYSTQAVAQHVMALLLHDVSRVAQYDALVNSLHAVTLEGYTISKIQREKGGETLFFFTKRDPTISGISFDIALRLYVCQDNVFEERYRAELTCNPGKEHMAIIDNYVIGERGQGYGSKGMEEIIHIAREQRLKMISGSLHPTDIGCNADNENRERVLRFYKKHGFTVQLAEDGNSGYVRLYL